MNKPQEYQTIASMSSPSLQDVAEHNNLSEEDQGKLQEANFIGSNPQMFAATSK
jgi:hypothetical protein